MPVRLAGAVLCVAAGVAGCSADGGEDRSADASVAVSSTVPVTSAAAAASSSVVDASSEVVSPASSVVVSSKPVSSSVSSAATSGLLAEDVRVSAAATSEPSPGGDLSEQAAGSFANSSVEDVFERFGSLAPRSLFERFEVCSPNGVPNSAACSGPSVGQFQFFASDAKAASMTQLLTELRSSRVVKDSGSMVVGWSTLGTTAIVTVVDNDKGVVMQHMITSDKQDPGEVIRDLHLAD
ncbi:hypothetical protein [Corynebacterium aquilae]|uniref:hypothetical protein n=1 Tax=Corynebacterium aquilae TaxID=203263 RepID=UPI0012EEC78A|nr:hypothetical protein [Corynebacterium aquilae]